MIDDSTKRLRWRTASGVEVQSFRFVDRILLEEWGGGQTVVVTGEPEPTEILLVPYFLVDSADLLGRTTFFAVRNGYDAGITVLYEYFAAGEEETPFATESFNLGGTEGLEGIHGSGTWESCPAGGSFTVCLEGRVHFD